MSRRIREPKMRASTPELLLSPLVQFFERKDRHLPPATVAVASAAEGSMSSSSNHNSKRNYNADHPLTCFFQEELQIRRFENWILIADKARTPHKMLCKQVGSKQPNTVKRNSPPSVLFRKSLSSSCLECCSDEDSSDLVPFQILQQHRWNDPSNTSSHKQYKKDRWNPLPATTAPVIFSRKNTKNKRRQNSSTTKNSAPTPSTKGMVGLPTKPKQAAPTLEEESPRSVVSTAPYCASSSLSKPAPSLLPARRAGPPRAADTAFALPNKPQRRPSIKTNILSTSPPPPPLFAATAAASNTLTSDRWLSGEQDSSPPPPLPFSKTTKARREQFVRLESDSSLICPKQTGRTLQASRPCYKLTWVKDNEEHN